MRKNNVLVSTAIMVFALGAGCAQEVPATMDKAVLFAGSKAPTVVGGSGGIATRPTAGSGTVATAGISGNSTTATPPTAGTGLAAVGGSPAAGSGPVAGSVSVAGSGPSAGGASGTMATVAGMSAGNGGMMMGAGACCKGGDCLCHGDAPAAPTSSPGPFKTANYDITSAGCVYYPMDAEPPFAAVTISDGFGGTGGCGPAQTNGWGPLYASWGIVAMIIHTGSGDQPDQRGTKLTAAVEAFKKENEKGGSPLMGKLSGRYGTSGFSMGGGGTTFSALKDPMLKTNVAIMAWGPTSGAITVPSLFIFGSSDTLANTMGMAPYRSISGNTPKMAVTVNSGHAGQPSSGGGGSGKAGLAFQKVFLEGDERWLPVLLMVDADDKANIQ